VWYNRLKKLIQNIYDTELLQQELEGHSKYQKLLELIEKKDANVEDLKAEFLKIKKTTDEQIPIATHKFEVCCPKATL
jgi:hypothetical protein